MLEVGKIFLKYSGDTILVALAVYENKNCSTFLLRKEVIEEIFNTQYRNLMIPDMFTNKGLLGTDTELYAFLSDKHSQFDIMFEKLIQIEKSNVKLLIEENKQLKLVK